MCGLMLARVNYRRAHYGVTSDNGAICVDEGVGIPSAGVCMNVNRVCECCNVGRDGIGS